MQLKTKEFQEIASTILVAVDNNAANLELVTRGSFLYLNVTNGEYYVAAKFELDHQEEFRAVVDAITFLNLVSQITAETFSLAIQNNTVVIKHGRSSYKTAMIYNNDELANITPIKLQNSTVEMPISNDILRSILNVNSKELLKVKGIDVNELQKLYYFTNEGCFTFTTGACLNSFSLEKPVKILLNDRLVKLFKLFNTDVKFNFGVDLIGDTQQAKAIFQTENIYVAAILNCDDELISRVQKPCEATKTFIAERYTNHIVISANELLAAITRLTDFTKNTLANINSRLIPATVTISSTELTITDKQDNCEVVGIDDGSYTDPTNYSMIINLADLKLVLDSCKNEHITLNCGNHRSIVITRGAISNLIPEVK